MKKTFTLFALAAGLFAQAQTVYQGNTKTGFGGPVGTGSLSVNQTATNINFVFSKGSGDLNDIVVLYFDSRTGGLSTTVGMTDNTSAPRVAVSGYNTNTEKSQLTFPTGFTPDFGLAITFGTTPAGTLFELPSSPTGTLTPVAGTGTVVVTANTTVTPNTYTFSILRNLLGLPVANAGFKFITTYLSGTAYRANEAIGFNVVETSFPNQGGGGGTVPNINWNNYTVPAFATYNDAILSTKLSSLTAQKADGGVNLKWATSTEENLREFVVEKLNNGDFAAAGSVKAANSSNGSAYSFTDRGVVASSNQYRLKLVNADGSYSYSQIVKVAVDGLGGIKVYPTVVKGGDLVYVDAHPSSPEKVELRIVSNAGITVLRQSLTLTGATQSLRMPQLVKGTYWMQMSVNGQLSSQKLIIE